MNTRNSVLLAVLLVSGVLCACRSPSSRGYETRFYPGSFALGDEHYEGHSDPTAEDFEEKHAEAIVKLFKDLFAHQHVEYPEGSELFYDRNASAVVHRNTPANLMKARHALLINGYGATQMRLDFAITQKGKTLDQITLYTRNGVPARGSLNRTTPGSSSLAVDLVATPVLGPDMNTIDLVLQCKSHHTIGSSDEVERKCDQAMVLHNETPFVIPLVRDAASAVLELKLKVTVVDGDNVPISTY